MKGNTIQRLSLIFFIYLGSVCPELIAQNVPPVSCTVSIHEFDTIGLDSAFAYLGGFLPAQLLRRLDFITSRLLSSEEYAFLSANVATKNQEAARKAVADATRKRDSLALTVPDFFERDAALRSAVKEYQATKQKLVDGLVSKPAQLPLIIPVQFSQENLKGTFKPRPKTSPDPKKEVNPTILIYGAITQQLNWLKLSIEVFSGLTGLLLYENTFYAERDDLDALLDELVRPVASTVLGREYALISIEAYPEQVDLKIQGSSSTQRQFLAFEETNYVLEAALKYHQADIRSIHVVPGNDYDMTFILKPLQTPSLTINTQPPGAAIYLDTIIQGASPLTLASGTRDQVLRIEKEGFQPVTVIVNAKTTDFVLTTNLSVALGKSSSEIFAQEKKQFLNALGFFICSLPVSVLSYGSFTMYTKAMEMVVADLKAEKISMLNFEEARQALDPKYYRSQLILWPALATSIVLGGNVIYRLVRYINSVR